MSMNNKKVLTISENRQWMKKAISLFSPEVLGKRKTVFGIGVNDANWVVQIEDYLKPSRTVLWRCPAYQNWMSMLRRIKNDKTLSISSEWKLFSNFYEWYLSQIVNYKEHTGLVVDKDLLVFQNTHYSKETCVLMSKKLNSMLSLKSMGRLPLGVSFKKANGKFVAQVQSEEGKKHIGLFDNPLEAHVAYLKEKSFIFHFLSKSARFKNNEEIALSLKRMSCLINYCIDTNTTLKYEELSALKVKAEKAGYFVFGHLFGSNNRRMVSFARSSAFEAHSGQKYGTRKYSFHLEQVAETLEKVNDLEKMDHDDLAKIYCVAYKHDEMEDCGTTYSKLLYQGFDNETIDAIVSMTKQEGESKDEYLQRLCKNQWAVFVKKADSFANLQNSLLSGRTRGVEKYTDNLNKLAGTGEICLTK